MLCSCPGRATGGRNRQKVTAPWGWRERITGATTALRSIQQQSGEEMINYGKIQPGHGKLLKRQREEQGLAMANVRSKWKAEEDDLCMK